MKTIITPVRNVNEAFVEAIWKLMSHGITSETRNGPVVRAPGPYITEYSNPCERLLFNPVRDANPVFHLMESIWMLAGERYVEWLLPFNAGFINYAEPNFVQHGAYGWRWRNHFTGLDQITESIRLLKENHADRRVVIGMWDPSRDLGTGYKDVPCNTHLYLEVVDGALNLTICCRSNDMLWGAYGANAVHFSILQEVIAHGVGVPVGTMYQISNNFHVYMENETVKKLWREPPGNSFQHNFYHTGITKPTPILLPGEDVRAFLDDCELFVSSPLNAFKTSFLSEIAWPLKEAYLRRKGGYDDWRNYQNDVAESDWKLAFTQWVDRREQLKDKEQA